MLHESQKNLNIFSLGVNKYNCRILSENFHFYDKSRLTWKISIKVHFALCLKTTTPLNLFVKRPLNSTCFLGQCSLHNVDFGTRMEAQFSLTAIWNVRPHNAVSSVIQRCGFSTTPQRDFLPNNFLPHALPALAASRLMPRKTKPNAYSLETSYTARPAFFSETSSNQCQLLSINMAIQHILKNKP